MSILSAPRLSLSLLSVSLLFALGCSSGGTPPPTATCSETHRCPEGLVCVLDKGLCALPGPGGDDMGMPTDGDGSVGDMAGKGDMTTSGGDMAMSGRDMAMSSGDMAMSSGDMAMSMGDMAMSMGDMAMSIGDMAMSGGDMGTSPPGGPRVCPSDHFCWENPLPQPRGLYGVWGTSATDVWSVGDYGAALHYDGTHWVQVPTGSEQQLFAVWGRAANQVWIGGDAGTILLWDGTHLTSQTSGTTNRITGFWGTATTVWATGSAGLILKWDGSSWKTVITGTSANLNAIWGSADNDVWAAGDNGTICHFGGTSWTCNREFSGDVQGLTGSSKNDIWAVGTMTYAWHWNGSTWSNYGLPAAVKFFDAYTVDARNVWAVGELGVTINWDGTKWISFTSASTSDLHAAWGSGASSVFAVGSAGTTMRYDGSSWSNQRTGWDSPISAMWGSSDHDLWVFASDEAHHFDGTSWTMTRLPSQVYSAAGSASNDVWAGGTAGRVYRFNGSTWTTSTTRDPGSPVSTIFIAAPDRVVLGQSASIQFWDGARYTASISGTSPAYSSWGSGPNNLWVGSSNCYVMRFDGTTWTGANIPGCLGTLLGIHGTGPSDVYFAAEAYSNVFRWDGGKYVPMAPTGSTDGKTAVFATSSRVYFTTVNGDVMMLSGGMWTKLVGIHSRLGAIAGFASDRLWVGGDYGYLLSYKP